MWPLFALGGAAYITDWLNKKVMGKGAGENLAEGVKAYQALTNPQSVSPVGSSKSNAGDMFTTTSPNRAVITTVNQGPSWSGVAQLGMFLGFTIVGYGVLKQVMGAARR